MSEITHLNPVWRRRSNFIIAVVIDPASTVIETEQLWATQIGEREFELCCIPFFTYGLALGDIVEVDADFLVKRVLVPSGRYVYRANFEESMYHMREVVARELEDLGALLEWSSPGYLAIDARDSAHGLKVVDYLFEKSFQGVLSYETGGP